MTVATPFTWGLGRRKSSVARVRIRPGTGNFLVNGKSVDEYFTTLRDQKQAKAALNVGEDTGETYDIWCNVHGGGPHGQAGAVLAEAAQQLGRSHGAIRTALVRLRDSLRRCVRDRLNGVHRGDDAYAEEI